MIFQQDHLYHVYNRSIARRKVFVNYGNYIFFLKKIHKYLLPHSKILAYCLIPDHFHLMVYVDCLEISIEDKSGNMKERTLNQSIGILLRSYTNALQNQEKFTGSLFQQHTKSICLTEPKGITPAYFETAFGVRINVLPNEKEYPQFCFDYIHNNPVQAGLVATADQWEFSSAQDYCGLRNGKLPDKNLAEQFGITFRH